MKTDKPLIWKCSGVKVNISLKYRDQNETLNRTRDCIDKLFEGCISGKYKGGLNNPHIRNLYDTVQFTLTEEGKKIYWKYVLDKLFNIYSFNLMELNSWLHCESEKEIANSIILGSKTYEDPNLWITNNFRSTLSSLSNFINSNNRCSSPVKICIVGGGAFPQTHIFLKQQTNSIVTTIERDTDAACLCQKVLSKHLPFEENVICIDGENANFSNYDVILIATLVLNKKEIFKNILKSNFPGIVIIRRPYRLHSIWREDASFLDYSKIKRLKSNIKNSEIIYNDIFILKE